ncbi:MAG: DMT family transporter [Hyphomonadaceae bacterium]|nr:DMT family transporter [Hyphomonadaceae bacterium]
MSQPSRSFAPFDFLQLLAIALIWGVNNVAAKITVMELPPLLAAVLRFSFTLICLIWWIKPFPREKWRTAAIMLLCMGPLHFGVLFSGLSMAEDLAPMVVAMQLWAPASVVFAAMFLGERVGVLRWLGVIAAFLGIAIIAFDPRVFEQGWALAIVCAASCIYGLGATLIRSVGPGLSPAAMQAWVAVSTASILGAGSALFERDQAHALEQASWIVWVSVLFGGLVSSVGANLMLYRLVQKYEVSRTTPYLLLAPLISFTLGALILGDPLTWRIALGAAASMAGVALVALAERRRV